MNTKLKKIRYGKVKKGQPLYAKIDWNKAQSLFQRPQPPSLKESTFPKVREVLRVVAAAGAIGMIFLFPHSVPGLALLFGFKRYRNHEVNQVLKKLAKQKYITIAENSDGKTTVKITKFGLTKALTYELYSLHIIKPKKWDKKWRVVIFDVPERYKKTRDALRVRLRQLGLHQLQESVYVSPYPCFNEVEFLRELYAVAFTTKYLLVEQIEDDSTLRSYFGLSS